MRNPDRIDGIMDKLTRVWKKYPDMRLGQLMSNLYINFDGILFYIEDDWLEEATVDDLIKILNEDIQEDEEIEEDDD